MSVPRRVALRFSTQVLLMQLGVLLLVCAGGFALMGILLRHDLVDQYERRALAIARTVAADDTYAAAVAAGDPQGTVQARAEKVRQSSDALFVVVTDLQGTRYSHVDPALLGGTISADQRQALDGSEVVIFGHSAAGVSARGKVPLRNSSGAVVGQVIVALSARDISGRLISLLRDLAVFLGLALILGGLATFLLTRRVKRQTLGLEPVDLRLLFEQQAALGRVATKVAEGAAPGAVFSAVTAEVNDLLGSESTALLRFEPDGSTTVVARAEVRAEAGAGGAPPNAYRPPRDDRDFDRLETEVATLVRATGTATRLEATRREEADPTPGEQGSRSAHPGRSRPRGPKSGRSPARVAAVGAPVGAEGRMWGVMVAHRTARANESAETEQRMAQFTDLLATAIANAESRAELRASRARVVQAADETRRRIERDLHDGTQQRLVSLGLQLRAAETGVPAGFTDLRQELSTAAERVDEALADVQEIARGLHPPILSRGGIQPALKALARRSTVPVELQLRCEGRLPDRVEAAVYYVVAEALTNAAKHAKASVVTVDLDVVDDAVHLSVRDDGVGGADPTKGSGLIGLRDRIEAFGGKMETTSVAGDGTLLQVTLPVKADA
jgi:signal transduction histidine kinase